MSEESRDREMKSVGVEWTAPPPAEEFHSRVLKAFEREFVKPPIRRKPWWRLLPDSFGMRAAVGIAMASCVFLVAAIWTIPKVFGADAPPVGTPWTVDSEFIRYADDGSYAVEMYSTSYQGNSNGEVMLSRSMPGNPVATALARSLDVVGPAWSRFIIPFTIDSATLAKLKQARGSGISVITGCTFGCIAVDHSGWQKVSSGSGEGCIAGEIVDRETILNHPTVAIRRRWTEHGRMTLWMAPDLHCFALRVTYETQLPDGTFHLVSAKRAVKITSTGQGG